MVNGSGELAQPRKIPGRSGGQGAARRSLIEGPATPLDAGVYEGPMRPAHTDTQLDRAPRPCSACDRSFVPTVRRRLLCARCFTTGD